MAIKSITRSATNPGANVGTKEASPIYVDSDDNILKIIPAESGSTEVQIIDASSAQTLTNKTITAPILGGFTAGSVLFAGPAGALSQDNANFFWDDTNNNLGIGTATPQNYGASYKTLEVVGGTTNAGGIFQSSSSDLSIKNRLFVDSGNGFVGTATNHDFIVQTNALTRMRVISTGEVGIGSIAATAALHIKAGSATAGTAPLKLTSGPVLATPEAGVMEYDGTTFYNTIDTTSGQSQSANTQVFRLTANLGTRGNAIADFFDASSSFPTVLNGIYELIWDVYFLKTTAGTATWTITNTQTYTNIVASYRGSVITGIAATGAVSEAAIVTTTSAAAALPVTGTLSDATNHHYVIRAIAECGTAGNIRLRITQGAGTVTPLRGSTFTARRLFAGNVGTFVA